MIPDAALSTHSPPLRLGIAVFLAVTIAFAAICAVWAHDLRQPRVTLLGSGTSTLSVLVTAGGARLLIATGDDPAAFATALERARHPISRRLDVVLIAGAGRDLLGPGAIAADADIRYLATIGIPPPSLAAAALRTRPIDALTTSRRIQLDRETSVDLELAARPDDDATIWRATIRWQETTVVVLSNDAAASHFAWPGPVAALVIAAGDDPLAAWEAGPAPLLAVPDDAINGAGLQAAASTGAGPAWAIRIFPGEAIRLDFGPNGIELAPATAMPLGTPLSSGRRWPAAGPGRTRAGCRPARPGRPGYRRR